MSNPNHPIPVRVVTPPEMSPGGGASSSNKPLVIFLAVVLAVCTASLWFVWKHFTWTRPLIIAGLLGAAIGTAAHLALHTGIWPGYIAALLGPPSYLVGHKIATSGRVHSYLYAGLEEGK